MGYIGKVPADVLIDPHVDSASIVDSTIVTADIANDAVTSAKLAQNSVDSSELIDGSVDNSHLAGSIAMNKTLLSAGTGLTLSTNTLSVDAAQTQITSVGTLSSLTLGGDLTLPQKIVHSGDTDTYLSFGTDSLSLYTGGTNVADFIYGNIYIKGNNKALSGYTTGGSAKELIKINGSDVVQIGEGLPVQIGYSNATPKLEWFYDHSNGTDYKANISLAGNDLEIRGSSGIMEFYTGAVDGASSTLALSIDSSQDATFADSITSGTHLIQGVSNYTGLEVKGSGGSRPQIKFTNVNNGNLGSIFATEGSAININTGTSLTTALTIADTQTSTFYGNSIDQEAESGYAKTVFKTWQINGTYTGDIKIRMATTSWKSVLYDIKVACHQGGGHWSGGFYHNTAVTNGFQTNNYNTDAIGSLGINAISGNNQGVDFDIPLNTSPAGTHFVIQIKLTVGGGAKIGGDDLTVSIS